MESFTLDDSILNSVKKCIGGIHESMEQFDQDIIIFINSELSVLSQAGVRPDGFMINDKTAVWSDFYNGSKFNFIQEFIILRVKMVFDPPQSSFVLKSMEDKAAELIWRIQIEFDE